MLVNDTIPNLIGGVTQQPLPLRLASQAELQENGYSSVVEGLRKRPPAIWKAQVTSGAVGQVFTHVINRDVTERYVLIVWNGDLKVFDLDGTELPVHFPAGKDYLTAADPRRQFRALTVADYTFILNTTQRCAMGPEVKPQPVPEALVWIKQGNYATTYTVYLNGEKVATYTTPTGEDPAHAQDIRTDHVAAQLASQMQSTGWTVDARGSTLRVRAAAGADFTIRTEDSLGDQAMSAVKGRIQRFSELPKRAFEGFEVEVAGDQTSAWDNYYVQYQEAEGGNEGAGVWKETLKPGQRLRFHPATMPHTLVREADGSFTFKPVEWIERGVGDDESNPPPSFVDKTLTDVFFHRNRLAFLSDENVIFSRAGDFFNFWRSTAVQLQDNDPIDVAAAHVKVSLLRHAVPWNEQLLLFSDQTQFILSGGDLLTPETAAINQVTEYESDLAAKPVGAGRFVYFIVNRGRYSGVRQYEAAPDQMGNQAEEPSAHIPQYIPGGVHKIAANNNESTLVLVSEQDPSALYVYRFYFERDELLMSAWSRWRFAPTDHILNAEYLESDLLLLVQRADGVHLLSIPTEAGYLDPGATYCTHLDARIDQSQVLAATYIPELEVTEIRLPYTVTAADGAYQLVTKQVAGQVGGLVYPCTLQGSNVVRVEGDVTGLEYWLGRQYEFRYRFSAPLIRKESTGGGLVAVQAGRLQLRNFSILYANSGFFEVEVTPHLRETRRYPFTGRLHGSGDNVYGEVALASGTFRFPVMCQNTQATIDLVNATFLPCTFLNAEWEGFYVNRSRRL